MQDKWKLTFQIIGKCKDKEEIPKLFEMEDDATGEEQLVDTDEDICREFNKYFVNVGPSVAAILPKHNCSFMDFLKKHNKPNGTFKFKCVNKKQAEEIIDKVQPKHSCGEGEVSNRMLKALTKKLSGPLAKIINTNFKAGVVPSKFKTARVVATLKVEGNRFLITIVLSHFSRPCLRLLKRLWTINYDNTLKNMVFYLTINLDFVKEIRRSMPYLT